MTASRRMRFWAGGGIGPLILALIALRVLVPAGYMLGPVDGRWSLVLCEPGVMSMRMPDGSSMPAAHAHGHAGGECPYSQSAAPALLPCLHPPVFALRLLRLDAPVRGTQTLPAEGPNREQFARGPPLSTDSSI
ncbi:MAG: hypothetical protein KGI55_09375 [Gammaproteobacteria bacterium]|nr:hypothetical protein [Gammaproteobacteria bacterium]